MEQTRRRRLSADAWRAVLARFAQSGMTVAAFCARESVGIASFYQWRSKLEGVIEDAKSSRRQEPSEKTVGFVDLGTLNANTSRLELRLDLGGGLVVHLVRG